MLCHNLGVTTPQIQPISVYPPPNQGFQFQCLILRTCWVFKRSRWGACRLTACRGTSVHHHLKMEMIVSVHHSATLASLPAPWPPHILHNHRKSDCYIDPRRNNGQKCCQIATFSVRRDWRRSSARKLIQKHFFKMSHTQYNLDGLKKTNPTFLQRKLDAWIEAWKWG